MHGLNNALTPGGEGDECRVYAEPYVGDDDRGRDADVVPALRGWTLDLPRPTHPADGQRRIFRLDAVAVSPHCLRYCHVVRSPHLADRRFNWLSDISSP